MEDDLRFFVREYIVHEDKDVIGYNPPKEAFPIVFDKKKKAFVLPFALEVYGTWKGYWEETDKEEKEEYEKWLKKDVMKALEKHIEDTLDNFTLEKFDVKCELEDYDSDFANAKCFLHINEPIDKMNAIYAPTVFAILSEISHDYPEEFTPFII